jgi:hypothetical protein
LDLILERDYLNFGLEGMVMRSGRAGDGDELTVVDDDTMADVLGSTSSMAAERPWDSADGPLTAYRYS